jgi:HPt (histidine-containing phosphotransfer) domain-containing protein
MDEPELVEIVQEFVAKLRETLPGMWEMARTNQFEELYSHAHWLKGCGGTCGFHELYEPSRQLELSAKQGDVETCLKIMQVIQSTTDEIEVDNISPVGM